MVWSFQGENKRKAILSKVHFAHNWNDGIMEGWNDEYSLIFIEG